MLKTTRMTQLLMAAGLAVGLGSGAAFAQDAGQDMKDAGHATKDAAVDTGHATKKVTKKAYHKTVNATETAADKTGDAARKTGHKTKVVAKTAAHRTENAGDAIKGEPPQH